MADPAEASQSRTSLGFNRSADHRLAQRVLAGDEAAQEELYARLAPRLQMTARHFLGWDDPDIEDMVQQVLLTAFEKLESFDATRAGLYTWTNAICVHYCLRRIHVRKRLVLSLTEDLEAVASTRSGPDSDDKAVFRQLERLDEPCRGLVRQRVLEEKSYAELADLFRIPMGTVASRLSRCLHGLLLRLRAEE